MTAPLAAIEHVCKQEECLSLKVKLSDGGSRTTVPRADTTALVFLSTVLEKECVLVAIRVAALVQEQERAPSPTTSKTTREIPQRRRR